ncbi:hypothetical protein M2367_002323 [Aeromonas sp. BIGb0445]|nr:hypothetical protein [Aeromonas sp. BIGb0445]
MPMPNRLATPHPNPLPQGERELLPWCMQCAVLIAPYASPARGEGMVTADDYAVLIDPTCILRPTPLSLGGGDCYRGRLRFANRPYSTLLVPGPGAVGNPVEGGTLAPCRGAGCRAGIRQRRYRSWLSLPQCAADPGIGKGPNGHPPPSYGARSTDIADSSVRIDRFLRWFNVTAASLGWRGASSLGGGRTKV